MVDIATEEYLYRVGLSLYPNPNSLSPDTTLASPLEYPDNMDSTPNQQTTPYSYTGTMDGFLGQDIHAEFPEGHLGTALVEQSTSFYHSPEGYGYGEYGLTLSSLDKSPELTGEAMIALSGTTPSTETDSTHFRQDHGLTSFDTRLCWQPPYSLPVGASSDWPSSSSGPLQQMGTSPLNGNALSMNPSEGNTSLDFDYEEEYDEDDDPAFDESPESIREIGETIPSSAEVDGTYIRQDHGPTNPPVQKTSSKSYKCGICANGFHAKKAVTRHFDDVHSKPKKCSESGCNEMIIGKRKLKAHLKKVHKIESVTPERARKPRQQIPKDAPSQVQPTSTQASSHQVYYVREPDFGLHEGGWPRDETFWPSQVHRRFRPVMPAFVSH